MENNLAIVMSQKSSSGDSKGDCRSSTGDSFPHPVGELQPSASAKEPDQPSPVSVLEAPFPDDLSSGSECFESISADLHGNLQVLLFVSNLQTSFGHMSLNLVFSRIFIIHIFA